MPAFTLTFLIAVLAASIVVAAPLALASLALGGATALGGAATIATTIATTSNDPTAFAPAAALAALVDGALPPTVSLVACSGVLAASLGLATEGVSFALPSELVDLGRALVYDRRCCSPRDACMQASRDLTCSGGRSCTIAAPLGTHSLCMHAGVT